MGENGRGLSLYGDFGSRTLHFRSKRFRLWCRQDTLTSVPESQDSWALVPKCQRHFYTGVELAALFDASPEVSNVPSLHKDNKYTIFSKDTSTPRCQIDFFLLLWRTPLERCCVHHAPPVITSSCLPSGRYKANVLLAKVCLHCTKPGVAS